MSFHVGQKVVCIVQLSTDAYSHWAVAYPNLPTKGCIYTVRETESRGDVPSIRLEEMYNPVLPWVSYGGFLAEGSFDVAAFRPLVERKTDISIFTKMLSTERLHERV